MNEGDQREQPILVEEPRPDLPPRFAASLAGCRELRDNWDGYGAPPISEKALASAAQLLTTAVVVPMSHGGVLVEMCGDAVSIELDENGEIVGPGV
jgi:hypothetical protein